MRIWRGAGDGVPRPRICVRGNPAHVSMLLSVPGYSLPDSFVLAYDLKKHSKLLMGPEPYAATATTATLARQCDTLVVREGLWLGRVLRPEGGTCDDRGHISRNVPAAASSARCVRRLSPPYMPRCCRELREACPRLSPFSEVSSTRGGRRRACAGPARHRPRSWCASSRSSTAHNQALSQRRRSARPLSRV